MGETIDRQAMLIYLENLRTLETIVYESQTTAENINKKYEITINSIKRTTVSCNGFCSKLEGYMGVQQGINGFPFGMFCWSVVIAVWLFIFAALFESLFWVVLGIICIISAIVFFVIYRGQCKSYDEHNRKATETNKVIKEKNQKICEECKFAAAERADAVMKEQKTVNNDIDNETAEVNKALQEAYSANIIPLQFRNIRGVYYLYDYLSTSNQTLSEALVQCNLEAIKDQLDQVIRLHGKQIIEQAKANQIIITQNKEILDQAYEINKNTAAAAAYSKICACNSMIALKMQSESLAYQRYNMLIR